MLNENDEKTVLILKKKKLLGDPNACISVVVLQRNYWE